jgi:hypothetical protein
LSIHLKISKYLSVVLVILILADIAGFALWNGVRSVCYHYVRNHRQAIAMRDTISMPAANYQSGKDFIRHKADEIEYMGQMFDIKKQIVKGDKILLIGHYDKFENKLFKLLYKLLDDDNKDGTNQNGNGLLCLDCIISPQHISLKLFSFQRHKYHCTNDNNNPQQYTIPITAPPEMTAIGYI